MGSIWPAETRHEWLSFLRVKLLTKLHSNISILGFFSIIVLQRYCKQSFSFIMINLSFLGYIRMKILIKQLVINTSVYIYKLATVRIIRSKGTQYISLLLPLYLPRATYIITPEYNHCSKQKFLLALLNIFAYHLIKKIYFFL